MTFLKFGHSSFEEKPSSIFRRGDANSPRESIGIVTQFGNGVVHAD
jgi:hypothetical protein